MAKTDRVEGRSAKATDDAPAALGSGARNGIVAPPLPAESKTDHGAWLIAIMLIIAAVMVVALLSMPGSVPAPESSSKSGQAQAAPTTQVGQLSAAFQSLLEPSGHSLPVTLGKLLLAALLGAIVGYRQRMRVDEYIVQAHVIIGFTGALMMIIIGNEIVRAVGLLGAGSIIRYRTPVRDPKALASLFVSMGLGIAVGVGLYDLALIATVVLVVLQGLPAKIVTTLPSTLYNPQRGYSVTLWTEDGGGTILRLKDEFAAHDVRYRLLEYDARAKKDGLVKIAMALEASAQLSTEDLTLLLFKDGVQSVSWDEEDAT